MYKPRVMMAHVGYSEKAKIGRNLSLSFDVTLEVICTDKFTFQASSFAKLFIVAAISQCILPEFRLFQ